MSEMNSFFAKEELPQHALQAKHDMKDLVDPDLLGLRKKEWNRSVAVARNISEEEDFQRKLTKIKMGLHDFPMPKYQEKYIEEGTDTRNDYTGWNVSTEPLNKFERTRLLDKQTTHSLAKTQVAFNSLKEYNTPTDSITVLNDTLRQKKREEKELREEIKKKYIFENPAATKERVNAGVFRMVYEHQVKSAKPQSEELILNLTFKPNLTGTLRPKIKVKAYHSGKWGEYVSPQEQEPIYCWSCCMDENHDSDGCVRINVDKDRWNLSSYGS